MSAMEINAFSLNIAHLKEYARTDRQRIRNCRFIKFNVLLLILLS